MYTRFKKRNEKNINVFEISEINKIGKEKKRLFKRVKQDKNKTKSAITEYLFKRKINISLFFIISIIGIFIGVFFVKELDFEKFNYLAKINENYNTNISSSDMFMKILNSVIINGICVFLLFLSGLTIFSPVVSSLICLIKGIFSGYIIGIIINSAKSGFNIMMCVIMLIFNTFIILMLILSASESLSFSAFILKNEESYKNSLCFSNISLYSLRHFIFFILLSAFGILQTITIPLIYAFFFS